VQPSRWRGLVLLIALVGAQILTVAALAGDPACGCNERVCVHHPGQHRAAQAQASVKPHCHQDSSVAAAADCTLRGCDHERDQLLPFSAQASLPHPTSVTRPEGRSVLAGFAARPLLDRPSGVEPPPPRSSQV
jgi:hypothetical protein